MKAEETELELDEEQKKQAQKELSFYKHVYACRRCYRIYGTDYNKTRLCPECLRRRIRRRRKLLKQEKNGV